MAGFVHQGAHPAHGTVEAAEDRFADQEVANVEFDDFRHAGQRGNRVEGQPVPGVDLQPEGCSFGCGLGDARISAAAPLLLSSAANSQ